MTPQEQQLLTSLAQRVNQTQLQEKDPDAENLLGRELGANPDAIYILAQTVLVQNIALEQAKAQVTQLQQQLQQSQQSHQPAHATSFLGRLLGDRDPQPAPPPPPQQPGYQQVPQQYSQPAQSQYAPPPPPYQQAGYQQPQYVPMPGGQPSFLRGAMQTAAGVAAGALAFEGVESILHGIGGYGHPGTAMGGFGMDPGMGMGGGGFGRPEETVINNYYDQPGTQGFDNDRAGGEMHHDASDQNAAFSDPGYAGSGNDSGGDSGSGNDQAGFDDSSSSDASGFDNGGTDDTSSFDSGGQDDGGSGGFDDGGGFGGDDGGNLV